MEVILDFLLRPQKVLPDSSIIFINGISRKKNMDVRVIIPAHNEEQNIRQVITKVKKYVANGSISEIIVINDGSTDRTKETALAENVTVLSNIINLGKGAALRTGCDYAFMNNADAVITIDADGQHNPEKIPAFVQQLHTTEIIFGYRELSPQMPFILRFGNRFINLTTKVLYNIELRDTQCGYRAFTRKIYPRIRWATSDYSMESEMITKVGKTKVPYAEVPIETVYNDRYKGTTVVDGIKIFLKLVKWRV